MDKKFAYGALLEHAFEELPEVSEEEFRFECPKVRGNLAGNRTIITNLPQIANIFRRPVEHVFKFLLRELATTGEMKPGETIFMGKFRSDFMNKKIEKYCNEFVLCPQCKKPDTNLFKKEGVTQLVCEACGAKHTVRTIK